MQLEEVRRRYDTARRRRQRQEPRLLAALRQLQVGRWRLHASCVMLGSLRKGGHACAGMHLVWHSGDSLTGTV